MRQHVNPLSNHFEDIQPIPKLSNIFDDPLKPLHLDVGCASGDFLFELAFQNKSWNYLGIEIREKLVQKANNKLENSNFGNLFFAFGNAHNLINECFERFPKDILYSISFYFPDPWFKKKHHKRRVLQPEFINTISKIMPPGGLLLIKSDVRELFESMDQITSDSLMFKRLNPIEKKEIFLGFNPSNLKTEREKYVLSLKKFIYEETFQRLAS